MSGKNAFALLALIVAALAMSACARTTDQTTVDTPTNNTVIPAVIPPSSNNNNPTPSNPTLSTNSLPPETFSFSITGNGGTSPAYTTPAINTDNQLVVQITAGSASQVSLPGTYSNFTANYSCVTYEVTVLGDTVQTNLLSVSNSNTLFNPLSQCAGAPNNQTIDFSSRLTPGHGPVTIEVSQATYDFYCQLFFEGYLFGTYSMYCPTRTVYKTHTVTGSLTVQINGTTL